MSEQREDRRESGTRSVCVHLRNAEARLDAALGRDAGHDAAPRIKVEQLGRGRVFRLLACLLGCRVACHFSIRGAALSLDASKRETQRRHREGANPGLQCWPLVWLCHPLVGLASSSWRLRSLRVCGALRYRERDTNILCESPIQEETPFLEGSAVFEVLGRRSSWGRAPLG